MGSPYSGFTWATTTTRQQDQQQLKMAKPDPYADIDFEEINDATNLAHDEIKCLKVCFDLFDTKKQDFLSAEEELKDLLHEIDEDGSGEIEFGEFCQLCATLLVEDPDMETMKRELRGLISELLAPLTVYELE